MSACHPTWWDVDDEDRDDDDWKSCADGSTCQPIPGNCHDQPLGLGLDPPGPPGSIGQCLSALVSRCTVVGAGEQRCSQQ